MSSPPPPAAAAASAAPAAAADAPDTAMTDAAAAAAASSSVTASPSPAAPASVVVTTLTPCAGPPGAPPAPLPTLVPMQPPQPPQNVRVENGIVQDKVDKPFVYGSAAFWQGKNVADVQHSYKWTVYVRGLENEDLSYFIKTVAFTLHESFPEPIRILNTAPYEVTESGWGEFAIGITITFKDESGLDPVHLSHMLKLFPPPGQQASTKKPVMSEAYDEFVFVNPSKEWWDVLQSGPTRKVDNHPLINWFTTADFAKEEDSAIAKLQAANELIQSQIDQQRARLFIVEQEITNLTQKL